MTSNQTPPPSSTILTTRTSTIPFNDINPNDIPTIINTVIAKARADLASIKNQRSPRTFDNTMLPLDNLGVELDFAHGVLAHLESVATTPEWRTAYNKILPQVTEFKSSIVLDHELWGAIKSFAATEEAGSLSGHLKRFLEKTIELFRRSGADLDPTAKARLNAINTELAELTNSFSQNTLDATNSFEYHTENPADLAGLPRSAIDMGSNAAASKGLSGWLYTLHAPSLIAITTYADNSELRERFYRAYNTRCAEGSYDNIPALARILDLRREKAKILGYSDFSDLVLGDRMAKDGEKAAAFVDDLRSRVKPFFKRETEELFSFVWNNYNIAKDALKPWDIAYYVEKMRKELYDFDEEQLRPYFSLPKVIDGLFEVTGRVFGIKVVPNTELPTWDKDVKGYSVYDEESNELLGTFYADLFPRDNKRGGAWMNTLLACAGSDGGNLHHVGLIAGNFTPPTDNTPALLTHDEVTTLFHEFGHLIHLLCNKTELRSQTMDYVAWDFIELPSQILENWCWERESLDIFAAHYQDSSKLPEELLGKMLRARNFRTASHYMRQLGFSTVDLALHREDYLDNHSTVVDYSREILNQHSPVELPDYYKMILSFTHLFSSPVGYASGYYSYLWAEVLDADAFSIFRANGIFDKTTGLKFRNTVLSSGDSIGPEKLFKSFAGRAPRTTALLERAGLVGG
jgi:oligopeptidase A